MLEAYSLNKEVAASTAIPFDNVTIEKGSTATLFSPATIQLNKCGVYCVSCNASVTASATIQLYKDGIAQPQAQSTGGTSPCFSTLVQVDRNNSNCCCASPVTVQIYNAGDAAATFDVVSVKVTKIC